MKSKFYARAFLTAFALLASATVAAPAARAQEEGTARVVDEVIAQVNTEVITLSALKREMREAAQGLAQAKGIPLDQAEAEVAKRQPEIIATLINEQLLVQKGKEIGMSEEVEAEVNRRMLDVMKSEGFKTLEQLEAAMNASGVSPASVRQSLRGEIMKQFVFGQEVDRKIYWSLTDTEVKAYYERNRDKFRKPETLTISEIFLSTVGKDDAEVSARGAELVKQLRAGGDFKAVAMVQSEREEAGQRTAPKTGGRLGSFTLADVSNPAVLAAIKDLKAGQITDPIKIDNGYIILRVDERTPAGEAAFDDRKVREAITVERLPKEREDYVATLMRDAYVEIAPSYRESVAAILKTAPPKGGPARANGSKKDDKKKN
ncbi:MAG TPA: peptidyl-prolyl cis-trans isomerase [Pyrinomonadaceae bacterium]|nr:peptidyl-prolyl cis-trans isomerase [Pyrinomonadaceae bacterium]